MKIAVFVYLCSIVYMYIQFI